jgi:hypothetical protein
MTLVPIAREELEKAKRKLEDMKSSKSLEDFEENWKSILDCLEKCWIKAERECQGHKNKFEPWQGTYKHLRRNDPLLSYLKQARDTDNHSIQPIVEKVAGKATVKFENSKGGVIEKLKISNGVITDYSGDPIIVEFHPGRVEAKAVTNSGKSFNPPHYHRGSQLKNPKDPIEIAKLGIAFYQNYLDQIDADFRLG